MGEERVSADGGRAADDVAGDPSGDLGAAPSRRSEKSASKEIKTAAAQLEAQFSVGGKDAADSMLLDYPHPSRIIAAQRLLVDLLLSGTVRGADSRGSKCNADRIPGGSVVGGATAHDKPRTAADFETALQKILSLLSGEIRNALTFRWRAEAYQLQRPDACNVDTECHEVISSFAVKLPDIRRLLIEDVQAAYEGDPAAISFAEVLLAYPGVLAVASHRIAHELYRLNVPVVPRIMSEWTHRQTGIDIHPGAQIGPGFFIDHGTGVVIGETAKIGRRVKLYQGVTLGAKSFPVDENGRPMKFIQRHPTVEDGVVIYANATILGGNTVIGANSTIGGNVFLMDSVPAGSFVVYRTPEMSVKPKAK